MAEEEDPLETAWQHLELLVPHHCYCSVAPDPCGGPRGGTSLALPPHLLSVASAIPLATMERRGPAQAVQLRQAAVFFLLAAAWRPATWAVKRYTIATMGRLGVGTAAYYAEGQTLCGLAAGALLHCKHEYETAGARAPFAAPAPPARCVGRPCA